MTYPLYFNSNNIGAVTGVELYNYDGNRLPTRDIKINKIARRDLSVITSSEYVSKEIPVYLDVCSGTRADTEATVSQVKALVQTQNGELIVEQGGLFITYTATMNEFNIEWNGNKAYVEIIFIASDPIGKAESATLFSGTAITTSTWASNITVGGNTTAYPVTTLLLNSGTGLTNKQIVVHNAKTNQGIRVQRTWLVNDLLVVDSEKMEVTVNGIPVNFTGMFPQFATGSQQVKVFDTLTTRNYNVTGTYQPKVA